MLEAGGNAAAEPKEQYRTKIAQVRARLSQRQDVFVAGEVAELSPPPPWVEQTSIFVAPTEPEYTVDGLNCFMTGLVEHTPHDAIDYFGGGNKDGIQLGKLYYDDQVGTRTLKTTEKIAIHSKDLVTDTGLVNSTTNDEKIIPLRRRSWIRVYPDTTSAQQIYDYEKGVKEATVDPDFAHADARFSLSGEQVNRLRREHALREQQREIEE